MDVDTSPFFIRQTPPNLRTLSSPDQLAFDTSLSAYFNLVRLGWNAFTATDCFQISSPLTEIPENRDLRQQRTSEIWAPLAACALMGKLNPMGPDGKVLDRNDRMENLDELAISFELELRNYYDLLRPMAREDFYIDPYGLGYTCFGSTCPLFCVPDYRRCRSEWRERAWGALAVCGLKGKLVKVGVLCGEGVSGESTVAVRPL